MIFDKIFAARETDAALRPVEAVMSSALRQLLHARYKPLSSTIPYLKERGTIT